MQITRGKIPGGKKVVLYGVAGIGKTSFAAQFPDPVFIDTEGSTKEIDVARFDRPTSWSMLLQEVQYVADHPDVCKTLVIDTIDWAERLEIADLCAKKQWSGLEDGGYGRGYQDSAEEIGRLLDRLSAIAEKGIHVVLTAHAWLRKVELPDEMGSYDHWEMKTSKKVAPIIREWGDLVLFLNYKTVVINVDGQGAQKGKNKAQGGKRVMYTTHNPCWDAKNRHGLADELPFDYKEIAHVIENTVPEIGTAPPASNDGILRSAQNDSMEIPRDDSVNSSNDSVNVQSPAATARDMPSFAVESKAGDSETQKALDALSELMANRKITDEEIRTAVHKRYKCFPIDTDIAKYPLDFIKGVLIGAFEQVVEFIEADPERLPF